MKVLKIILPILFVISSCTGFFNDRILNRYQTMLQTMIKILKVYGCIILKMTHNQL